MNACVACYSGAMKKSTTTALDTKMEKPKPTALDTKKTLLEKSQRKNSAVPLRRAFVQSGSRKDRKGLGPGPLADFVRRHDALALDLYLLMQAITVNDPYEVILPAQAWARMLATRPSVVSRAWARLEERKLIARRREHRRACITALREDGLGVAYVHPGAPGDQIEPYLQLNYAYWLNSWDTKLSLPAKAMLLVALSLPTEFVLPQEKAPAWYGLSADTVGRGLGELWDDRLLDRQMCFKEAPLSPLGYTEEIRYRLRAPFFNTRTRPMHAKDAILGGQMS